MRSRGAQGTSSRHLVYTGPRLELSNGAGRIGLIAPAVRYLRGGGHHVALGGGERRGVSYPLLSAPPCVIFRCGEVCVLGVVILHARCYGNLPAVPVRPPWPAQHSVSHLRKPAHRAS